MLIADDEALLRTGFRMILHTQDDITVTGEAADGDRGRPAGQRTTARRGAHGHPDASHRRHHRHPPAHRAGRPRPPRIIILTTYDLDEYVFDALAAGASGFLLKDVPPGRPASQAIRHVAAGDALLAPRITRRLIAQFARCRPARISQAAASVLTPRELEVLALVATGQSNTEIAAALHLSENTVKTHLTHVLDKLGLRDRVHAVVYAYETGIVQPRSTGH